MLVCAALYDQLMRKILFILCIVIAFINSVAIAQGDQYQFSRLNIDNGLSHNRVTCIFKDSKGFIWFGTKSGLNRYDGYSFKIFKHDFNNPASINDDYIVSITSGPNNKLWVKTRKGFNIYDPLTDRFDHHMRAALKPYGIPDSLITSINKDVQGNYWFMHTGKGLYKFNPALNQSVYLTHNASDTTSVHAGLGTAMAPNSAGDMWVIYNDGVLEKVDHVTNKVTSRFYGISKTYPYEAIDYQLAIDEQNDVWAFTPLRSIGAFYVAPASGVCKHLGNDMGTVKISSNIVFNVIQDDKGLMWIATDHGGINLVDKKTFKVSQIVNRPYDNRSLSQDCIVSLYRDNANIIWLGTFKKGICYYHHDIIKFPLYRHQTSIKNSLSFDDINRFLEDKQGNLWIGSNGGGLIYFNRKTGLYTNYTHNPADPNSLGNNVVASLCIDHTGKLWIGTYFGGIDCFDGKTFKHYRHSVTDSTTISDNSVWEIMEDSQNRLWIGTLSGGLNRFDQEKQIFYRYLPGRPNSVPNQYVSGLLEDDKGNIWVATYYGLAVLQNHSSKFIYYKHNEADKESLSNDNVSNLMMDSRKLIWIATNEGLSMYDAKTNKFKTFRQVDGLPDNAVLTVVEDDNHNLWISTAKGLSNMIIKTRTGHYAYEFKNYDKTDGLQGKEFNEDAGIRTHNGELVFGGADGFNIFKPENVRMAKEKPVLVLTDFQLFNKSLQTGQRFNGHVILKQSITETKDITLKHNENVFAIEFAAVNFFNPAKIKHAYMLDGFDKGWNIADNNLRKASYMNLAPGTYTFKLKAAGEDGHWGKDQIALKITVLPPWWLAPWAYLVYAFLIWGAVFYLRYRGIKKLKANFTIEKERQEAQRMHELDLMKIKFFTNVSHEFRTPLALILAPVEKLLKQEINMDVTRQLQMINRNGRRLLNLVNQLLDFRKMEEHELTLNYKHADIVGFIREAAYSFSDIAENKKIALGFDTRTESIITNFDQDKIERILFNLLSNAFKFTHEGGRVEVRLSIDQKASAKQMLKIEVIDDGIGIPPEKLDKIFDRFFQNDVPGSMVNQGSGIGLAITREFVNLHQGSIKVKSIVNQGSCFVVLLPVSPDHILQDTASNVLINQAYDILEAPKTPKLTSKKATILLIEDNDDFRFYLKDNLKECYHIVEASNGRDGWQKALASHPALIVSDISMPEMNGIDLCCKIKQDQRTAHIPVILLTALSNKDQYLRGLEIGACDYLTKPFNFEILLSRIKNVLNNQDTLKKTYSKQLDVNAAVNAMEVNDEKFMTDMMNFINKRLDDPGFSVEQLSSEMAMSRVTLYRKVLQMTERSPVEFIKMVRLKHSAQLLENTHLNIAEVAYKVGFNNPKYFAKSFKIEFNMLPTDYRSAVHQKEK
jgi:signal transduction histidine kinase/ligand-binding sensor domain-containing protein/DNA-binding response OmpR family regulator